MAGLWETPEKEQLLRIKTIMVLRIVFLTGFIALAILFQIGTEKETPIGPISLVLGIAYVLSISYALLLKIEVRLNRLAWLQVIGDTCVIGGMIYSTGGIESPLSFLFLFVVISTSVMLPKGASYFAASGVSIVYGLIVDLEYFKIIEPIYFFPKSKISYFGAYGFYIIALNVTSYFAVAFLSSFLAHRLWLIKNELQNKSKDLKKLQLFHKNVVQNMVSGLMTTDLVGRVTSVNAACESISGFSLNDCLGRFCYDLIPMKSLISYFKNPDPTPPPLHLEGECIRKDGENILVSLKISYLIHVEDEPTGPKDPIDGYIFVIDDLTEIRKMEEKMMQSEQLAAVGKFSAGLAHEIRNPLASLSGSIQVLKNGLSLEGDYQHLMNIVIKETERLNGIVSDFLNYSQPKKTKNTVIDLTQLLEDVILLLKNSNEYDPAIEIDFVAPSDHVIIQSEESQIKQMIWNLCINGIQAMTKVGRLKLEIQTVVGYKHKSFETSRKGVLIMVIDQGKGIPPEKIEKIFDPFFTTREEGVGLGLPTVQKIVKRFGGNIGIESEVNKGTRFEVFLPQERALLSDRQNNSQDSALQQP